MHIAFVACILLLFPLWGAASQGVSCSLNYNGDRAVIFSYPENDALGGVWKEMGKFQVHALLATPANRNAWLLVEVYARASDGDLRIISSQKMSAPFFTGRMEVVEPELGRSLEYECRESK